MKWCSYLFVSLHISISLVNTVDKFIDASRSGNCRKVLNTKTSNRIQMESTYEEFPEYLHWNIVQSARWPCSSFSSFASHNLSSFDLCHHLHHHQIHTHGDVRNVKKKKRIIYKIFKCIRRDHFTFENNSLKGEHFWVERFCPNIYIQIPSPLLCAPWYGRTITILNACFHHPKMRRARNPCKMEWD